MRERLESREIIGIMFLCWNIATAENTKLHH